MSNLGKIVFLVAMATSLLVPRAEASQFRDPVYYIAGAGEYFVVSDDFNNDGNLDLAVADYFGSRVSILLGNGDGTFQKARWFSAPNAIALAVGDFNEDKILDIAVLEYGGTGNSSLGIYLGRGHGKFHKAEAYKLGIEGTSITVADFDGDGHLDVAATNLVGPGRNNGNVMVFPGKGNGKLGKATTYKLPGAGEPKGIAAGDLNGDGYPDLAVAEYQGECVAVLLNNGSGKFGKPVCYPTTGPSPAISVAIADFNHDGVPDLVVGAPSVVPGFNIFFGDGTGQFGTANYYGDTAPYAFAIADFEHDGNLDIVTANPSKTANLWHGNRDGTYRPIEAIPTKYPCGFSVASGDFDNDGVPDLAITMYNKNKVAVLLNAK